MHSSSQTLLFALAAAGTVYAHGKPLSIKGDAGGLSMPIGTMGAAIPLFGKNADTEKDTTVFGTTNPMTDGLGKTAAKGRLKISDIPAAIKMAGSPLAQVKADGTGEISGTWAIVTSDGTVNNAQGDLHAVIDPTATGTFSKGIKLTAHSKMVGNGQGNVVQRSTLIARALQAIGILPRATNVGATAPFTVKIPAGIKCIGTVPGVQGGVCMLKVANNNGNGAFGGIPLFQIAGDAPAIGSTTPEAGSTTPAAGTGTGTTGTGTGTTGTGITGLTGTGSTGTAGTGVTAGSDADAGTKGGKGNGNGNTNGAPGTAGTGTAATGTGAGADANAGTKGGKGTDGTKDGGKGNGNGNTNGAPGTAGTGTAATGTGAGTDAATPAAGAVTAATKGTKATGGKGNGKVRRSARDFQF